MINDRKIVLSRGEVWSHSPTKSLADMETRPMSESLLSYLLRLTDTISALSSPAEIQQEASRMMGEFLKSNRAGYAEDHGDGEHVTIEYTYADGVPGIEGVYRYVDYGPNRLSDFLQGRPVVRPDIQSEPTLSAREKKAYEAIQTGATIAAPVVLNGRIVAIMFAHQQESRDWNSDETRVVQETAERTWRAVERARVTEAFKESEARLSKDLDDAKRLQKISGELIKEEDTVALFQEIVDTAIEIMRSDMGTLQMYDSAREELRLISTRGFHSDAGEAWSRINIDSGTACAAALMRGERVIVPDVTHSDVIVGDANEEYFAISGIRSVQSTPLISRSGRIVGMISTHWKTRHVPREGELRFLDLLARQAADILDRTNAAGALRASEERFRLLSESFYDFAIFTTDADGRVVTWNPGAEKIFGFSPDDIIGHTARLLFVPEDQAKGEPEREMTTAREKGRAADERWHMRKDGRRFYASGIMAPLYEGEALIGYAKIARDLTKEKQFQEELRRQHEELEAIVAGRTAELGEANDALREQIEERERMEAERFALLQKLVTSQEDERRRIARDMHDSLGQQLTALRLKLASMKTDLYRDGRLGEGLERLQELAKRLDEEVNFLVWELRPTVLDDLGLVAAIENYVQEWVRHYGISAEFHAGKLGETRLAPDVETNLYRITQEALNNTYKHAKAKNANIVLESRNKEVVLVIEDDGIGFNADAVRPSPEESRGLGLVGMRERASIIGGKVEIESSPGNGTTVFVRVPMTRRD